MTSLVPAGGLPLGIGCSRLGSVGGANRKEAQKLLHTALDEGVRFFDTSNIYGQGDSERFLAEALKGRDDCAVVTKAGKYLPWAKQAMVPLKGALRATTRRSQTASQQLRTARAKPIPTRWDAQFLSRSLDGSLRRLMRDRIDIFLLHSPTADVIRAGDAVTALDAARTAGKVDLIGVAVDDVETALACLADGRVKVLQIPLRPGSREYEPVLAKAPAAGVSIVAREILGGPGGMAGRPDPAEAARGRIAEVVRNPRISVPLVGVSRPRTLNASIKAVREAI